MSRFNHKPAGRFEDRIRDLIRLMAELLHLHEDLLGVVQRKLLAMRKSDVELMQTCTAGEIDLTGRIRERDGLRKQILVLIAKDLNRPTTRQKEMTVSELLKHVSESEGNKMRALAGQLSFIMGETAKVNTVVQLFAQQMLDHYREIFERVTRGVVESPTYVVGGRPRGVLRAHVVDAIG